MIGSYSYGLLREALPADDDATVFDLPVYTRKQACVPTVRSSPVEASVRHPLHGTVQLHNVSSVTIERLDWDLGTALPTTGRTVMHRACTSKDGTGVYILGMRGWVTA